MSFPIDILSYTISPLRYLVMSMVLIAVGFILTTIVLNLHYRKPSTHTMPGWVKRVFIKNLPRLLFMKVPIQVIKDSMKSRRSKFLRQSDPALKTLAGKNTQSNASGTRFKSLLQIQARRKRRRRMPARAATPLRLTRAAS